MCLLNAIRTMLTDGPRNQWLHGRGLSIYVRVSRRIISQPSHHSLRSIKPPILRTFDIANVECAFKGRGIFTKFLGELEDLSQASPAIDCIYIENVLNSQFAVFFRKRGYTELGPPDTPCFYKEFKK